MCLAKIVFAVFVCTSVINNVFISGDDDDEAREEKTEPPPLENHSFVALIDIVFTDGSKRTCTGTIIHDNAVVTAAHCFLTHEPGYVDVELSGSFVVIGTKKMFDTGYENYLPIERIITHPRYRGWTANLALVFTFTGMTTEKPGNVIPLIGEGSSTPVDSNVTILSWGRCRNEEESVTKCEVENKKRKCSSSGENHDSCEPTAYKQRKVARSGSTHELSNEQTNSHERIFRGDKKEKAHHATPAVESTYRTLHHSPKALREDIDPQQSKEAEVSKEAKWYKEAKESKESKEAKRFKESKESEETKESKYVRESKEAKRRDFDVNIRMNERNISEKENLSKTLRLQQKQRQTHHLKATTVKAKDKALKYFYKDWRRKSKSHSKENKLTVESFGFVNVQTCKKIVDKTMPRGFAINTNEVVCYAADEHYISDDDSGAPAIRQGHLVAVTVGGAQYDGDHVAVGMRMNCFCSWIVENLPPGDNTMECCENCCNGTTKKETKSKDDAGNRQRHRKHSKVERDE